MPYEVRGDMDCWEWSGHTTPDGHPAIRTADGYRTARRVYWERENGPIPAGKVLRAMCGNVLCVRPRHHAVVTRRELIHATQRVLHPGAARRARFLARVGWSNRRIASVLGCDEGTVRNVLNGTHWSAGATAK